MCGIAGTAGFGDAALLRAMTDVIAHRGPDGEGFFVGDDVFLGNRRLAIQDVAGGTQPMSNEDGSVVVVYNGEIYNYPELRELVLSRGHRLETHCDTEVLPHLYEDEGMGFLERLNGIFAFALYDRAKGRLFVVRDPLGVKPLVYAVRNGLLAFGSEAKAILASGLVSAEMDETSLHLSMNVRYVPGERTFFRGISRLAARARARVCRGPRADLPVHLDRLDSRRVAEPGRVAGRHPPPLSGSAFGGNCSRTCRWASRCRAASTQAPSWR